MPDGEAVPGVTDRVSGALWLLKVVSSDGRGICLERGDGAAD